MSIGTIRVKMFGLIVLVLSPLFYLITTANASRYLAEPVALVPGIAGPILAAVLVAVLVAFVI